MTSPNHFGSRPRIGWKPFLYDRTVASVRLRSLLPSQFLSTAGFETTILPQDAGGSYDCVVFQKAYEDADLALAERLAAGGTRIVFDLCDNHFWNPDDDPVLAARAARLRRMLELADVVTVSTPELVEWVAPHPAVVVDDAVETPTTGLLARCARSTKRLRRRVGLVWFGNAGSARPPFGMIHLGGLIAVLERLNRRLPLRLTVISNSRSSFANYVGSANLPVRYVPWRARSFARHVTGQDVCVLPIERNPLTVCKSHNRLLLSLLLGVPVVAGDIPSYREFADWVLFEDWGEHITRYATDPELARRHVDGARDYVHRTYTPERVVDQWSGVLRMALDQVAS